MSKILTVCGIETKKGKFEKNGEEIKYSNVLIHTQSEIEIKETEKTEEQEIAFGNSVETFKISAKKFQDIGYTMQDLIGQEVKILYDKYGKVETIEVIV